MYVHFNCYGIRRGKAIWFLKSYSYIWLRWLVMTMGFILLKTHSTRLLDMIQVPIVAKGRTKIVRNRRDSNR